ncbi:MAG: hypothetical protein CM1200mP30_01090 [Pseudomonadota bacterium]|nr:MAG: hypothetical protein CM1200mP30_01090 [Pseudomonadota bacterium]
MGLYITGLTAGVVTALSITNSVVMPWLDGDWREVLKIYSYLVFLSGLIWIFISANQESRDMEEHFRNIERPPQIRCSRSYLILYL